MSVSSGSSSSAWSEGTAKSDARSRKSSASGWTNSGTRSKERRIPDTPAVRAIAYILGARPSKVESVRVYEDTFKKDFDSVSHHRRVETRKEIGGYFVAVSARHTSHSSRRRHGKSWDKGSHRRGGSSHYSDDSDDDDDDDEDASERSYGQPVPPPVRGPGGQGPMGGSHPQPPPAGYPGHPGNPPPGFPGRPGMGPVPAQFVRPPPGPGGMPYPGAAPGFRPPQPQPQGFASR